MVSYLLSLGLLALGDASCNVMRHKHPHEEAHMVWNEGLLPIAILEEDSLAPDKSSKTVAPADIFTATSRETLIQNLSAKQLS